MNITKYFSPPIKAVLTGPQMFEWINSRTSKAFDALLLGKGSWCHFPSTHPSQNGNGSPSFFNDKPSTKLCHASNLMSFTLKWPNYSCHKWRLFFSWPTWAHSFAFNSVLLSPRLVDSTCSFVFIYDMENFLGQKNLVGKTFVNILFLKNLLDPMCSGLFSNNTWLSSKLWTKKFQALFSLLV